MKILRYLNAYFQNTDVLPFSAIFVAMKIDPTLPTNTTKIKEIAMDKLNVETMVETK